MVTFISSALVSLSLTRQMQRFHHVGWLVEIMEELTGQLWSWSGNILKYCALTINSIKSITFEFNHLQQWNDMRCTYLLDFQQCSVYKVQSLMSFQKSPSF